jgi:hypothetical protein
MSGFADNQNRREEVSIPNPDWDMTTWHRPLNSTDSK